MRTEEEKVTQSPVTVILGGERYEVKPLPIKLSLPWVKKVADIITSAISLADITNEQEFRPALNSVLFERPLEMVDLFFEYARDLDRDKIENVASSAEIVAAFQGVMTLESPLFSMMLQALGKALPQEIPENLNLTKAASARLSKSYSQSGTSRRSK